MCISTLRQRHGFSSSYLLLFFYIDFSTPLHKDAAVVFLVDSSENVESNDFKRQREFVISLVKAFKIPENGVRASVITYGKEARPSVQLKDSDNFDRFQDSTVKMHRIQGKGTGKKWHLNGHEMNDEPNTERDMLYITQLSKIAFAFTLRIFASIIA